MKNLRVLQGILWVLEGIIVGFGAIMPGISGGTLCVAFGMYKPLMGVLSTPRKALKTYWRMLLPFVLGCAVGFVGLSGLASMLMEANSTVLVCLFIGLILGTVPGMWRDAGKTRRTAGSFLALGLGFALMLGALVLLKQNSLVTMEPGIWSFLFCGILWGISFVVPGLSSSTLLLFFGLYQPMLEGISHLSLPVLIPLAAGVILCMVILPKGVEALFRKWHSEASHAILGIVAASTLLIFPVELLQSPTQILIGLLFVIGGAVVSYALSCLCDRLQQGQE